MPLFASSDDAIRLAIDGRANAMPSIASRGDVVAVAWGATPPEGGADVYVAVSRDAGASFGAPVRVDPRAGEARLSGEQPPRIALGPAASSGDPIIYVVWGARRTLSESTVTEIRSTKSLDGGKTFEAPQIVSTTATSGDRGWHAATVDTRGVPHVLWLDHRAIPPRKPGEKHVHGAGPDLSQLSGLYYAGGGTRGLERELTRGVCYCCKTALAVAENGTVYAAWRHVYPGSLRDIAFTMSPDGGKSFVEPLRVSEDNWKLAGCPDDGPAMAIGVDRIVHLVWPTVIGGETPEGALFYSATRDGRRFAPRIRIQTLGSPKPSHPQIVSDGRGGLVIAWDEVIGGVRQAAARPVRFNRDGHPTFGDVIRLGVGASSAYPVMTATSRGVIAAWTRGIGPAAEVMVSLVR
jgi:hypothetical protein